LASENVGILDIEKFWFEMSAGGFWIGKSYGKVKIFATTMIRRALIRTSPNEMIQLHYNSLLELAGPYPDSEEE
jgi:hypothetical protein